MNLQKAAIAVALVAGITAGGLYGVEVAAQRSRIQGLIETGKCLDCDLKGADLARLDLKKADLSGANLEGADLQGTNLGSANLQRTNLRNANLEGADLGCNGFSFSVRADGNSNFGFQIDRSPITPSPSAPVGMNLNTTDNGATVSLNFGGCPDLTGATLQGARMPDGSVHP
ncbi:MAG: pentapeptide repeat-containing protein [Drouetiella hepatica Uher 2000/2452]|jgi:uncharacterized protein YjbI with pentapeptide repeats|uniref:Pentapeptide repeat-containing protein n=1 Tax=Drouetiella hepatica Uher 2000/2452 TaxID=904376 RepID=A0A951QCD0_9CYAN|nr:pentapeptide repeat-containing protein [Drouetiella hepatica Uher 2000/2452]